MGNLIETIKKLIAHEESGRSIGNTAEAQDVIADPRLRKIEHIHRVGE